MVRNKYLHRLKQHAHETGAVLKFEEISKDPEENRFIMRAVLGGRGFPNGVGSSAKKAKQNAAKEALRSINDKENQETKRENAAKNPAAPLCQNSRTTATFDQQSSVVTSAPCPSFVIFDEEDMTTPGKNKKKVRRKLKYNQKIREVSSESAVSEDGLARLSLPQNTQSFCRAKSKTVAKIGSSNRPNVQDTASSEGINPSEMPSVQSQTLCYKSEFDDLDYLGKGAYGRVFKARHKLLDMYYAIKIVPYKKEALREVEALSNLDHYHIVRFFSCWIGESGPQSESSDNSCSTSPSSIDSSTTYLHIQMALCDTDTLREWIDKMNDKKTVGDTKRRRKSLTFMQQMVSAVEHIHSKKFIHRDLKPSNIMFGQDGNVKIGDFGLVTVETPADVDDRMERTLSKGTENYMAPEQKSEKLYNRKVDIFPLGLIYFELVWKLSTYFERGKLWSSVRQQKLPQGFSHRFMEEYSIIRSMLSAKPEDRPEASEVKTKLDEYTHRLITQEIKCYGSQSV